MYVKPKKHLGQHFLTDLSVARRIADSLYADRCNTVLEVGCGTGVLTRFLLERKDITLYGAEVDGESVAYLHEYYPDFLVDKIKDELQKVINLLESGETDTEAIQETLDEAVCGINDLQDEFYENDSEIETVARDCIGVTVAYILEWFGIPIDMEEAIRERDW